MRRTRKEKETNREKSKQNEILSKNKTTKSLRRDYKIEQRAIERNKDNFWKMTIQFLRIVPKTICWTDKNVSTSNCSSRRLTHVKFFSPMRSGVSVRFRLLTFRNLWWNGNKKAKIGSNGKKITQRKIWWVKQSTFQFVSNNEIKRTLNSINFAL